MGHYHGKTSRFFGWLVCGLSRNLRLAIVLLSKSLRSLASRTNRACLIFELPDELILSILSYVSPDPQLIGRYARFRAQYILEINDYHRQRALFLLPLSMTCKTMRLRLLPWIWERYEASRRSNWVAGWSLAWKLSTFVSALHADTFLAPNVKFITVHLPWYGVNYHPFITCLESLPNLHTLEIGWTDELITSPLNDALEGVKLPQIKNLILPPVAHPLLQHCCNVEDVACVVKHEKSPPDGLIESLASNQDSKIKRLAIPPVLWVNTSKFVAACPRLTELTIVCPHPNDGPVAETGILPDPNESVRSAVSELVIACKVLSDFDTFQIVHFPHRGHHGARDRHGHARELKQSRDEVKGLKDWVMNCLKSETGRQEGEGRKKTTLRVIKLSPDRPLLSSVEVEVYTV